RAERSTVPAEASALMDARDAIAARRGEVVAEFERLLRAGIDERCGAAGAGAGHAAAPAELKLLEDSELEESVLAGDVARAFDDLCEGELGTLTQRIGALLGNPDLERVGNPFAPLPVFEAFRRAWESVGETPALRQRVLREMTPAVLGDVKDIYT